MKVADMSGAYYARLAMGPTFDVLDMLAVIFGILFTVRKLDASRRQPGDFPEVAPDVFLEWRRREGAVYTLGSSACFLKVVVKLAFLLLLAPQLGGAWVRAIGAAIDLTWVALVVVTLVRGSRIRAERKRLGILLR
jgi:hypothetical protein